MADVVDLMLMAAAREPYRQAAIAHYHTLLEKSDVAAFAQELQEELRKREVIFGGRFFCPFLRPHFIGREQFLLLQDAVRGVTRAISALTPKLLTSKELKDKLHFTEEEKRLIAIDPGYPELSVTSRMDSFLMGGSLQFVEYNAETPAGIAYSDEMARSFMRTRLVHEFTREYPCQLLYSSNRLLQALLDTYEVWGGTEKPTIGIIDYDGLPTIPEFDLLCKYFQKSGYKSLVADPRKLEYHNGALSYQGQQIHIVYKRLLTNEYLDRASDCQALWQAYKDRAACFVNCFRCKYLHKKAIFAILSDPKYQEGLSATQLQAIYSHVPWTRVVEDCKTTAPDGQTIDLLEWIRRHRENLVMKPNDDYGGHGVMIGWEKTDAQWDEDIKKCLATPYVVQVKVDVTREHYPTWDGQKVSVGEYAVDLDPYIFNGRASSMMTRLSGTSLCNVTSGGGATATFILD